MASHTNIFPEHHVIGDADLVFRLAAPSASPRARTDAGTGVDGTAFEQIVRKDAEAAAPARRGTARAAGVSAGRAAWPRQRPGAVDDRHDAHG